MGLEHFVGPIRQTYLASDGDPGPSIFILGPSKPADWYAITNYDHVYYVQGNPFLLFDLERVNYKNASTIFVSSPPRIPGGDPHMGDADAIFIVRMIEAELALEEREDGKPLPPVIAEITMDSNHHFLPLPDAFGEEEEESSEEEVEEAQAAEMEAALSKPSLRKKGTMRLPGIIGGLLSNAGKPRLARLPTLSSGGGRG